MDEHLPEEPSASEEEQREIEWSTDVGAANDGHDDAELEQSQR